jgi:hypothetical protein
MFTLVRVKWEEKEPETWSMAASSVQAASVNLYFQYVVMKALISSTRTIYL